MNIFSDQIGSVSILNFFLLLLIFNALLALIATLINNFTKQDSYAQY